jgi:hypothetical protein
MQAVPTWPWGQGSHSYLYHCRCYRKNTGTVFQSTYASWRVQSLAGCIMNMALRRRPPDDATRVFAEYNPKELFGIILT